MFTREYFFDRFNSHESELRIENLTPQEKPIPLMMMNWHDVFE